MTGASLGGLLFDKDGTLFDFAATWTAWTGDLIEALAGGAEITAERLAAALGYDRAAGRLLPDSPVIAGTPADLAAAMLPVLPGTTPAGLIAGMNARAAGAPLVPAVPLAPLMRRLAERGLALGLATNDAEGAAHAHLAAAGIAAHMAFVAGYDSGFGAKPRPGMLLAFADRVGLAPSRIAMVGDSRHDLLAGRAAGMRTVAVLTGMARAEELAPLADVVLPDIGHLPGWIDTLSTGAAGASAAGRIRAAAL